MPNVDNFDNESDWMAHCVPMMVDEGRDQDQAVAACLSMWRNRNSDNSDEGGKRRAGGHSPMEYKSFVQQVKQVDGRTVTGFAAIFGNVDSGGDRVLNGAFKKTIKERARRVRHLWQHDITQPPVAAIREMKEVGKEDLPDELRAEYPEATGGLVVVREYLNTPRGDEVLEGIIKGAINEMSFGYDPVKDKPDKDVDGAPIRNLIELKLWDTSDVNWGMNEATIASKRDPSFLLTELLANLEAAQVLEPAALQKAGRVLSAANLERLKAALETLTSILSAAEPITDDGKTVIVASLTDAEIAQLKARYDELQRQIKFYHQ